MSRQCFGHRIRAARSLLLRSPATGALTKAPHCASSKVVGREVLRETPFMRFLNLSYVRAPEFDKVRSWQAVERTTTEPTHGIDAVAVCTIVRRNGQEPQLLVVKQFRPPLDKYTVELCAGLVDPGETVEEAALRELKEETGYSGRVVAVSGQQYVSPGLTNENIVTVYVEADGDALDNEVPLQQSQEDEGAISVMLLPLGHLYQALQELEQEGYGIWVGLYSLAQGMRMSQMLREGQQQ